MTLAQLRAARPSRAAQATMGDEYDLDAVSAYMERFAYFGVRGTNPAELSDDELMTIFPVVALVGDSDDPEHRPLVAFADAVAHEFDSRMRRHQAAAPAALAWLNRNDKAAKTYLVAWLYCPNEKQLARMYCLPKDIPPVHDSGGHRLLIVPNRRGRLSALGGSMKRTRKPGVAWWYMSDDDVWDLGCKCCRRPDGGVRARDFLSDDPRPGYRTVLA